MQGQTLISAEFSNPELSPPGSLAFIRETKDSDIERHPYATIVDKIEELGNELEIMLDTLSLEDVLLEDNSITIRSMLHEIRLALLILQKRNTRGVEKSIVALDGYASMFDPDKTKRLHGDISEIDPFEYLDNNVAWPLQGCRRLMRARNLIDEVAS